MPGKGYKPASPEVKEQARAMRKEGQSIESIAADLGVSTGSVSGWCRDIPARRTQVKKEVPSREGNIMEATAGAKLDSDTIELANRVRKARLQAELDEIDDRKQQRQEVEDLRLRERRILLELDTARQGTAKGETAVVGELTELRRELSELREARHQAELHQSEDRHQTEIRRLEGLVSGIQRTGLTELDIMSRVLDKGENLAIMVTDKVDRLVKGSQGDKQLMLGLQLGLSPAEFQLLQRGEQPVPEYEDFILGRKFRSHRDKTPYVEPEEGEFEGLVSLIQQGNRRWAMVQDKAARAMGQGGSQAVCTGKTGTVPAPGEAEPLVLKSESKLVTCSRCGTSFDIDVAEARQSVALGKKLFVHCANPKCNFLLDLKDLVPELEPVEVKSATPECYVAGEGGRCANPYKGLESYQCQDCQWSGDSVRRISYE